jgi:GATA-binding protein, other eukaryote
MANDVHELAAQRARTAKVRPPCWCSTPCSLTRPRSLARQPTQNRPSGIAQLRKSSEQAQQTESDRMNLDEFIVPTSIGTPAGVSPGASSTAAEEALTSTSGTASGIPIKQQQRVQADELQLSRASAPSVSAMEKGRSTQEFNYVPRHVRKTSIDERGVWSFSFSFVYLC